MLSIALVVSFLDRATTPPSTARTHTSLPPLSNPPHGPDLGGWWRGGPCYSLAFAEPPVPVKEEVDDAPCDLKGRYVDMDVDDRPTMDEMCMSDSQRDYYEFS